MTQVTCAISGIKFTTSFCTGLSLPATEGFPHPIFAAPKRALHSYYAAHCRGKLTATDSYLTFLAILHSSGKVSWKHCATLSPTSPAAIQLVEQNIAKLVEVLEKTDSINHPSFSQPALAIYVDNSDLSHIPNWIKACKHNIDYFYSSRAEDRDLEVLKKVEKKLSYLILSGEKPEACTRIIADWACKAASFPIEKSELWKDTIRSCASSNRMFNTPLDLLKEIKDYCECNIDVGTIHFHALSKLLKAGIARHIDYLGGSSLALGYTLLPNLTVEAKDNAGIPKIADSYTSEGELKNQAELAAIAAKAPASAPKKEDYPDSLSFLKARLAYRLKATKLLESKQEESNATT